uniref:Fibrinogen C-terminal domain-containing protein n=1 Tax=Haemonchus placei TaxID=6290 RepID=A0A0N4XC17_HAEPC
LGNELLHQLTYKDPKVTLRVEMRGDRTKNSKNPKGFWWNHYFKFRVGSEATDYTLERLHVDKRKIQGNASTGWYDMTRSVGAKFSTVDKINDPRPDCVT